MMAKAKGRISSTIKIVYLLLVVNFLAIVSTMVFVGLRELLRDYLPFFWLTLFLLGAALLVLTIRSKLEGGLRKFLLLTGLSSFSFFVFVVLHNFFYAVGVVSENIAVLPNIMEVLEVASFLLAMFACPLGFLVGVIGVMLSFCRKK